MTTVLVVVTTRPSARHLALGAAVVVTRWAALVASNAAVGVPPSGVLASAIVFMSIGIVMAAAGWPPTSPIPPPRSARRHSPGSRPSGRSAAI